MTTAIFIKTYKKDLEWLTYCLRSIEKFTSGFSEVVIVADENCRNKFTSSHRIEYVPAWSNGYIHQQWIKINADSYTHADQILYVDSDCTFFKPVTPATFTRDGKPILLKIRYTELENTVADNSIRRWQKLTTAVVGFDVEYEYMRRMPLLYLSATLSRFRAAYPALEAFLRRIPGKNPHKPDEPYLGFSEFNAIGAFVERFEPDLYYIVNTLEWDPERVMRQLWSWGGLTDDVRGAIEGYLA